MDGWGVQREWVDADGRRQEVDERTVTLLHDAIGTAPDDLEERAPLVTRRGRDLGPGEVRVRCEDGAERSFEGVVPDDLPFGYHRMRIAGGPERLLVVSPGRCWLPERRTWGWAVQLYGARSSASWGIGDLGDLRTLRTWTEGAGGGFLLVNPLHAVAPTIPQEASPYLPATRRFRNPVYLRVEETPGWSPEHVDPGVVRRVAGSALVDRDAVWDLKRGALFAAYGRSRTTPAFTTWCDEQGEELDGFATWCALAEEHGADWRTWPEDLRSPGSDPVAAFRDMHHEEIGFHRWLQWQLEVQLAAAAGDFTIIQDLPIGVSGGGADAWSWQDVLATGVTVGAPPDALNGLGQDWGSPPLVPWRLRAADYEPFIQSVRRTIAGAGGLRIDHVMGLFRLWWIPQGAMATEGAYVRYPSDDLLDIVALESHRARAVVVGEDLGTVEPGVPEALAERDLLSYRVLMFEDQDPANWSRAALATVTTHDLPTVAGLWTGSDAADQVRSTGMAEEDVRDAREALLSKVTADGLPSTATAAEAVAAAYTRVARAPSLLVSLTLEDAVLEERRPNVPGTTDRDNWCLPLPVLLDQLTTDPRAGDLPRLVASEG
ncbi:MULTISPECIES: 4-alpha-glucanotransferase [unclassified Nocardioides]|uniref:4-alpha-glucanotransferase n=1 Tax=unclassified Nocardioides TaxID=2615069 RepID=UPI003014FEAE